MRVEPFGDGVRFVLPGGLTVYAQRAPRLPIVAVAAAVQAGAACDPPGRAGLSTMTVELLRAGTERLDEEALARAFADLGTSLRTDRGQDWVDLSARFLAADLDRGLALLAEVLLRPAFPADKVERVRRELLAERESGRARAEEILVETFYRVAYAGHPYEFPIQGTDETLAAISRADVVRFHAETFVAGRTTIAIAGDIEPERAADAVGRAFAFPLAPARPPAGGEGAPPRPRPRPGVFFVHKPDQSQAHLRMGHPAIPRAHPDFDALLVANYVLGGAGLSSRIAETVRTRNGLAYAAGSFLVPRRLAGPFAAVAQTRSETCVRAIELVRAEIERVRSEPLPEEDLDTARRQFAGSLPFRLETVGHKAGALLEAALYDLGPRHLERQIERVSALAPEEVRAAARAHLAPEQATIVVVGERAALFERLRALGEVMEVPPP